MLCGAGGLSFAYVSNPSFDIVVAADAAWGIGKNNGLPWPKLRADLQHFKRITSEAAEGRTNAIIMGRKTWQSAEVKGRPLPRRLNCVISRQPLTVPDGVLAATSLDAALAAVAGAQHVFVVGGAEIYRIALTHPALRFVYLTRVAGDFGCDTHIPNLDEQFVAVPWSGTAEHLDGELPPVHYRIEKLALRSATEQ